MSRIGFGYGSEWHLMHYLGRHRTALEQAVLGKTGGTRIQWLDCPPCAAGPPVDSEWQRLDFLCSLEASRLADYSSLLSKWDGFWPRRAQCWDAVGVLHTESGHEWILVEAKAHTKEMETSDGCGAGDRSLRRIQEALSKVRSDLGVDDTGTWTGKYYQYTNRLAALWFLLANQVPARLVYIYFTGDPAFPDAPPTEDGWQRSLDEQDRVLGLNNRPQMIEERVHKVFLPALHAFWPIPVWVSSSGGGGTP